MICRKRYYRLRKIFGCHILASHMNAQILKSSCLFIHFYKIIKMILQSLFLCISVFPPQVDCLQDSLFLAEYHLLPTWYPLENMKEGLVCRTPAALHYRWFERTSHTLPCATMVYKKLLHPHLHSHTLLCATMVYKKLYENEGRIYLVCPMSGSSNSPGIGRQ